MKKAQRGAVLMALVAVLVGLVGPGPAEAASRSSIPNDADWYDVSGNLIGAQGGSVLKVGSVYYWVGIEFAEEGEYAFGAVNLYKSSDLMNWQWVKAIFTPQGSGDFGAGRWVGRPDLVYNPSTGRYVLVMEIDGSGASIGPGNKIGFASSSSVEGSYTYHGSTAVNGSTMGDHSVFVDGSKAYLIYAGDNPGSTLLSDRNVTMNIAPLAANWLSVKPAIFSEPNAGREAPFIMKVGTKFHWFSSGKDWWDSTATKHRTSTSLTSWPSWTTVATSPYSPDTFNTQFDFVLPVTGSAGTSYLVAGDRYTNFQGTGYPAPTGQGRNAWMPLTFSGDVPTIHGFSDVRITTSTGALTGNAVSNARFENEGPTQSPAAWQEWGDVDASFSEPGGRTGNRLAFWRSSAYEAYTYQWLTGLTPGTYKLSAMTYGSGASNQALLIAKPSGGAEAKQTLNTADSGWVERSLTFSVTSSRSAEIGVYVRGPAASWLLIDNVTLTRQ